MSVEATRAKIVAVLKEWDGLLNDEKAGNELDDNRVYVADQIIAALRAQS